MMTFFGKRFVQPVMVVALVLVLEVVVVEEVVVEEVEVVEEVLPLYRFYARSHLLLALVVGLHRLDF